MSRAQSLDYVAVGAPLGLAVLAVVVLLLAGRLRPAAAAALSLAGLGGALAWTGLAVGGDRRRTLCLGAAPEACSYATEPWTTVAQAVVLAAAIVVVLLAWPTLAERALPAGETCFLLLSSVTGALVLAASRDLVTLVVALEVVSLPVFALAGLRRRDGRGAEAALKLFLVSVVSAAVMLYGASLLYAARGTLFFGVPPEPGPGLDAGGAGRLAAGGIALVLAGFAFKLAAVPFHSWAPDTYQGAPLPVAAYLSVVSKTAGVAGLLVLLVAGYPDLVGTWAPALGAVAAATMVVGNLVALRQRQAVRLLAWSSVAQAGYILVPLGALSRGADPAAVARAAGASLAYAAVYAAMNLAAFAVVASVGRRRPRNTLADYRGLAWRSPVEAAVLGFALACLAGLPPGLVGLFAKVVVFRSAVDSGAGWLAVVMAVATVVGLAYYLAWGALLVTREEPPLGAATAPAAPRRTPVPAPLLAAGLAATAVAAVWSVAPQLVLGVLDLLTAG